MIKILIFISLLSSQSAFALLETGQFISKEGCLAHIQIGSKNTYKIEVQSSQAQGIDTHINLDISADYKSVIQGPSLCNDARYKTPKTKISNNTLEVQCGGFTDLIDINLKVKVREDGHLLAVRYLNQVAKLSDQGASKTPQPKETKENLTCTGFQKI